MDCREKRIEKQLLLELPLLLDGQRVSGIIENFFIELILIDGIIHKRNVYIDGDTTSFIPFEMTASEITEAIRKNIIHCIYENDKRESRERAIKEGIRAEMAEIRKTLKMD